MPIVALGVVTASRRARTALGIINPDTGTADKCTWCYHRVKRGESPACVEVCPVGARLFGRLDDPDSEISKRIAKIPTQVLKEHLGTHPKTRYLGISQEVI